MQHIFKAISIGLFLSILLASCGPVTRVPLETNTPPKLTTSTETSIPAILNPSETPDSEVTVKDEHLELSTKLWKNLPPFRLVDQYQLASWKPDFTETMIDLLDRVNSDFYPYIYSQSDDFHAAFASEAWLRTGSKMENKSWLCKVNYHDPETQKFPDLRPGQDLFSFFVEDLINNRGVAVDDLPEAFSELIGTSDCLGWYSLDTNGNLWFTPGTVQNLFGDGQESYVFPVGSLFSSTRVAVYATHIVGDHVQVELVRNWERYTPFASAYDFQVIEIGDLNRNGRNEFALQVDFGASGIPRRNAMWIYLYEWDSAQALFKESDQTIIFNQECEHGACYGGWQLSFLDADSYTLTTQEYFWTDFSECELITLEKEYLFDFDKSILLSDRFLAPNSSVPECQISWAFEKLNQSEGWRDDSAVQIIANALNDWPEEMNASWGEESKNYFQLRLGLWRDFRGEVEQSFELLDPLRNQQANSTSTFLAQLAQTYLEVRQKEGLVAACSIMNNRQDELLTDIYGGSARKVMGFWDMRWDFFVDDFCDENVAMSAQFSGSALPTKLSEQALTDWLLDQGKQEIHVRSVKVGEQEIWLASFLANTIEEYDIGIYQVWGFVDNAKQRNAVFLNEMRVDNNRSGIAQYNKNSVIAQVFEPENSEPILLVEFDECLAFVRVIDDEVKVAENICDVDIVFSYDSEQVNVMKRGWTSSTWEFVSYKWDEATESLQETPFPTYDFESVQKKAESLVFKENDYASAIVYINNLLLQSPPDHIKWPDCYEYIAERAEEIETQPHITLCDQPMEWHRPYLLYLLGLSYEMFGQVEDARNTYYSLWYEYPTNVFGVAASLRLEPIKP